MNTVIVSDKTSLGTISSFPVEEKLVIFLNNFFREHPNSGVTLCVALERGNVVQNHPLRDTKQYTICSRCAIYSSGIHQSVEIKDPRIGWISYKFMLKRLDNGNFSADLTTIAKGLLSEGLEKFFNP